MFKGLRTKIESEQKGHKPSKLQDSNQAFSRQERVENVQTFHANDLLVAPTKENHSEILDKDGIELDPSHECIQGNEIKDELSELRNRLQSVIKERDQSNEQNVLSCQLIEKLRVDLEKERETNTSLQTKLHDIEASLKERDELIDQLRNSDCTKSIVVKPSTESLASKERDGAGLEDVKSLRQMVDHLQNQLSEKSRLLKIRQQNTNDIKKTLQKEMMDHSKTQKELSELKNQFKQLQLQNQASSTTEDSATLQNGSSQNDTDLSPRMYPGQFSDRQHELPNSHDESELHADLHLESMSNLSRSGASVEDFESNDLQHNISKEINYEYLKNVLYRYMTSTDTETAQHLVKAISVLMNFSPEQSAAVKSAMYSRSSWLRLK